MTIRFILEVFLKNERDLLFKSDFLRSETAIQLNLNLKAMVIEEMKMVMF